MAGQGRRTFRRRGRAQARSRRPFPRSRWRWGRDIAFLILLVYATIRLIMALQEMQGPARAMDGDSLKLEGREIRLFGIDAPELHQTCTRADGGKWPCGRRAKERLAALLRQGEVACRSIEQDRWGRDVAVCKVKGEDIAATLVREGLAVAFGAESPYRREEAAARNARRGLWQGPFERPETWRQKHRRQD